MRLRDAISETGVESRSKRSVRRRGDTLIAMEVSRFNCRDHARDKPDRFRARAESERE